MAAQIAHPPMYGSSGGYSYIVFLWLPKYSFRVLLWYQRVAPPQVTDPVEGFPIRYSYGCHRILIFPMAAQVPHHPKLRIQWMVFLYNIIMAAQVRAPSF